MPAPLPPPPSPALKGASASAAALLALALCAPGTAAADTTTDPLEGNRGFLVVVEGDATLAGNESEGPVAIGGDLSFGAYNVAAHTPGSYVAPGDEHPSALVVNGSVDLGSSSGDLKVLQSGLVKVGEPGGSEISTTDANGAEVATVIAAPGAREAAPRISLTTRQSRDSVVVEAFDVAALFPAHRQRSAGMAACDTTVEPLRTGGGGAAAPPFGSGANVTLPLEEGANVWNVDARDLADLEVITFEDAPSAQAPLLVNVDTSGVDGDFAWHTPNMAGIGLAQARHILFNFPGASAVTFTEDSRTLEGTVYAPDARVRWLSPSNIEGAVVAASFEHGSPEEGITGNGELHNGDFRGELPLCGGGGEEPGTPEGPEPTPGTEEPGEPEQEPTPGGEPEEESPASEAPDAESPAPVDASEGALPVTGANVALLVAGALAAVAAGTAAVVAARRRRA
ncbi:choice-of-anchor A family protein [Nocardiopsis flavescens]|uniref:choice-of-anchor A family protein n=1 Tax=Nocardiopsis flavescens TaxID=758803 RepID=UPI0036663C58